MVPRRRRSLSIAGGCAQAHRLQHSAFSGADLRAALDAALAGWLTPEDQKPSIGCNIKWKAGNEPEYFGQSGQFAPADAP